ncbi:MAG: hypothetical protein R6V30_08665 [Paracoccaceae bacterium]
MSRAFKRLNMSDGERSVFLAYCAVAMFGAGLSFVIINGLGGGETVLRKFTAYDLWSMVAGTVGAPAGLYISRRWFGGSGIIGWARMLVGVPCVAFFGGIAGGTLALPFYGTMFGPFSVAMTFWAMPLLALFFVLMLVATHMLFAVYHRERDTLFRMPPDDGIPA